jgi:hypothetical protein
MGGGAAGILLTALISIAGSESLRNAPRTAPLEEQSRVD